MLRKARMETRLLELLPPQNRTLADFDAHFKVRAGPRWAHGATPAVLSLPRELPAPRQLCA